MLGIGSGSLVNGNNGAILLNFLVAIALIDELPSEMVQGSGYAWHRCFWLVHKNWIGFLRYNNISVAATL